MTDLAVWLWNGINYLLAVMNDIIRFKLVFIIPLFLLYTGQRAIAALKRKRKA